jgi:hypothetical protein
LNHLTTYEHALQTREAKKKFNVVNCTEIRNAKNTPIDKNTNGNIACETQSNLNLNLNTISNLNQFEMSTPNGEDSLSKSLAIEVRPINKQKTKIECDIQLNELKVPQTPLKKDANNNQFTEGSFRSHNTEYIVYQQYQVHDSFSLSSISGDNKNESS